MQCSLSINALHPYMSPSHMQTITMPHDAQSHHNTAMFIRIYVPATGYDVVVFLPLKPADIRLVVEDTKVVVRCMRTNAVRFVHDASPHFPTCALTPALTNPLPPRSYR